MRTVILEAHRSHPSKTVNKFKKMNGTGTVYITDSLKERYHTGMVEISDNEIELAVKLGKDILYRVSTFGGGHRVFRSI